MIRYIEDYLYKLSWEEIHDICLGIAKEAESAFCPDAVVGTGKGGLIPATIIASVLQVDILPCLLTRKRRGRPISQEPLVISPVAKCVSGRKVLVVDDVSLTGETLRMITASCLKSGARAVKTACVWACGDMWKPTYYGIESPNYIMFPWDYEVMEKGRFVLNPLYKEYMDSVEVVGK